MNKKLFYIFLALWGIPGCFTFAQNDCEVPLPPILTSVSVMPETSSAILNWTLSESSGIAGYIVYLYETRDGNSGFFAIDTLWNPSATSYSDRRIQYKSFQYRIAAFRVPKCVSELSNILSTIYVETSLDTCNRIINITWNNYMPPAPEIVTGYTVLKSVNGSIFNEPESVPPNVTSLTVNDLAINTAYCFKVTANLNDESFSSSTISCKTTKMPAIPEWINADYATVTEDNEIFLSFSIDPASEIDTFALEKRTGYSGLFQKIKEITGPNLESVNYTDKTAETDAINFYRLSAVLCKNNKVTSNVASNIVLEAQNTGDEIILRWNKYHDWLGSVSSYSVFADKGYGYDELAVTGPADTSLTISIPNIMFTLPKGKVCFYITASETGNPYGITGESTSNRVCTEIEEVVTVPNVFSPDGDGINDKFKPVITFTPASYQLTITDRQRKILFETRNYDEYWDVLAGGNPVSQGVYLWFLKITTPSGKKITRTGTVTVIKTR